MHNIRKKTAQRCAVADAPGLPEQEVQVAPVQVTTGATFCIQKLIFLR